MDFRSFHVQAGKIYLRSLRIRKLDAIKESGGPRDSSSNILHSTTGLKQIVNSRSIPLLRPTWPIDDNLGCGIWKFENPLLLIRSCRARRFSCGGGIPPGTLGPRSIL
ncbi:MAG: hypothetical protein CBC13_03950 [Planctomycetia bacterium TMED53]|nr:MAG: hypothetical protein CBC13_03950 [Planctomycetia bacterium TMED53]